MWQLDETRIFQKTDLVLIHSEYEELVFHDFPILFTGRNVYYERMVGSFVEHLTDTDVYLHSIVDEKTFSRFENRFISYRELLRQARFIFNLHFDDEGNPTVYWVNFDEIPIEYLPSEAAMCPLSSVNKSSIGIEARFIGGRSESHLIEPETASAFQVDWAKLIRRIFRLDGFKNLVPSVLLDARENEQLLHTGSVRINYQVELQEKAPTLFFDASRYAPFIEAYVIYCLNNLSQDAPLLAKKDTINLPQFQSLVDKYIETFNSSDREREERLLAKNILEAAKKLGDLTELMGTDVQKIEFNSLAEESAMHALGVFDGEAATSVEESLERIDEIEGKAWVKESRVTNHRIHIYDLNVDTRKGRAILPPDETGKVVKPLITISGDHELDHTKFTASLHESKMINVRARATKSGGQIKKLEIEFEDNDE